MRYLVALIVVAFGSSAMAAGTSQGYGAGGRFAVYDPIVTVHNKSGELFRIEGRCQSSCTLFLGIRNVCIERSAVLAFHAGLDRSGKISAASTQHMLNAYKPKLRRYLLAGGYTQTQAFHSISGGEMIDRFGYKECPPQRSVQGNTRSPFR
jgi:hypothetical protein